MSGHTADRKSPAPDAMRDALAKAFWVSRGGPPENFDNHLSGRFVFSYPPFTSCMKDADTALSVFNLAVPSIDHSTFGRRHSDQTKLKIRETLKRKVAVLAAPVPPADANAALFAAAPALVKALEGVNRWARARCPCEDGKPDPCTLCGARIKDSDASDFCKAVDSTFPPSLLSDIRKALSLVSPDTGVKS